MEAEIFNEIKSAEIKADEIIERANLEKEKIIQEAKDKSSRMLKYMIDEIDKEKLNKIQQFKEKAYILRDTRISEANEAIMKLKEKAYRKMASAVGLVIEKFYNLIKS